MLTISSARQNITIYLDENNGRRPKYSRSAAFYSLEKYGESGRNHAFQA